MITYLLRIYPELSETFVAREVEALAGARVPVAVIAIAPGSAVPGAPPPGVEASYLTGKNVVPPLRPRPAASAIASLIGALGRDLASLRLHPRRSARAVRLAFFALAAARRVPLATVRLHAHFANDAAALARYTAILTRLPYRVTAHAYDLYRDPFLVVANLAAAERIYTVSQANLAHIAGLEPPAARRKWDLRLLRPGLDLAAFPFREPPPAGDTARIVGIARLVPKKGHAVLLDALARLRHEGGPAFTLDLAGDGPLAADLKDRAAALGLDGVTRFHGAIAPEDTRALLAASDLAVLAARIAADGDRDGLPVTLIEAMAIGVPVVATAVAGIPELVRGGDTGWVVAPDRPDLLAAAMRQAIAAPQAERVARARRARALIEQDYDVRRQVEELRGG